MKTYYDFYPQTVFYLGAGFDPSNLTLAKPMVLNFTEQATSAGAEETSFGTSLVRNASQLKSALKVDLSIDASYLIFKGSASFSMDETATSSADSASIVLTASARYGRRVMKDPQLTPLAQRLLDAKDHPGFARQFGTHYVAIEHRGASVSAIFTISDLSSSTRSVLSASVEGGGGWGPLKASAKAAVSSELQRASQERRLDVRVVATGGTGFSELDSLIRSLSSANILSDAEDALGKYVKTFTPETSAPIGFSIGEFASFGLRVDNDLYSEEKERCLLDLVTEYRQMDAVRQRIGSLLDGIDPYAPFLSAEQRQQLPEYQRACRDYQTVLATVHKQCLQSSNLQDCRTPDNVRRPAITLPTPPKPSGVWLASRNGQELNINDSWVAITSLDRVLVGQESSQQPVDKADFESICFKLNATGVRRIEFRFESDLLRVFMFTGFEKEIRLYQERDLAALYYIGEEIKAGRDERTGSFYLVVADMFGRESRLDLIRAKWERFDRPPQKWRISQYDRVPYSVVPQHVLPQQLVSALRMDALGVE